MQKRIKAPKLVSCTISAVIATAQYSNISPSFTVEASSVDDAVSYILPKIDELFIRYHNKGVPAPVMKITPTPAPVMPVPMPMPMIPAPVITTESVQVPAINPVQFSEAFVKAKTAINSCQSMEALTLVSGQVDKSKRLTDDEKKSLKLVIAGQGLKINGKN